MNEQKRRHNPWIVAAVVLVIILAAASMAINMYADAGLERAQLSEAVLILGSAKTPLEEYFRDHKKWPVRAAEVVGATSGKYTGSVEITGGAGGSGAIEVTAKMKAEGVKDAIAGTTVRIRSTDGRTWTCSPGTAPAKYLPNSCRN